jgi:large subunit ribosomal protein L3
MSTDTKTTENTETQSASDAAGKLPQFLLGEKGEMTQVFTEDGEVEPATVVSAGPIVVTQVKTVDTDGYSAYQFGYGDRKDSGVAKPQQGHTKEAREVVDKSGQFAVLREYRLDEGVAPEADVGDSQTATTFTVGDTVTVSGISKGKGFQGVVKRHGFAGGPRKHGGQKSPERGPGSIGATGKKRVMKGKRMAGRMGGRKATVENLGIVHVDADAGDLYIKGGLPGPTGSLLEIVAANN